MDFTATERKTLDTSWRKSTRTKTPTECSGSDYHYLESESSDEDDPNDEDFSDGDVDPYDEGYDGIGDESDNVPHVDGADAPINVPDNTSHYVPIDASQPPPPPPPPPPAPTIVHNNALQPNTTPQVSSGAVSSTTIEKMARNLCEVVKTYTPDEFILYLLEIMRSYPQHKWIADH